MKIKTKDLILAFGAAYAYRVDAMAKHQDKTDDMYKMFERQATLFGSISDELVALQDVLPEHFELVPVTELSPKDSARVLEIIEDDEPTQFLIDLMKGKASATENDEQTQTLVDTLKGR